MRVGRHRRLALASAPIAVLVLLLAAKLLSLSLLLGAGTAAIARGDGPGADRALRSLAVLDLVEPWKAPFARGDAAVVGADLGAAREEFERALRRAPDDATCVVRVNLVLTIEQLAEQALGTAGGSDEADEAAADAARTASADLLRDGLEAAAGGDGDRCSELARQRLDDAQERLTEKLVVAELPRLPGSTTQAAPAGTPSELSQEQLDSLAETQEQAAAARSSASDQVQTWESTAGNQSETPW